MKKTVLFIPLFAVLATAGLGCSSAEQAQTNETPPTNEAVTENTNVQKEDTNINDEVVNQKPESDTNESQGGTTDEEEVDTSDWLTYTNEEYGFSFEHPETEPVKFVQENDVIEMRFDTDPIDSYASGILKIKIISNSDHADLNTWIQENVDVNNVLRIEETKNSNGISIINLSDADSILDYGDYAGLNHYFSSKSNDFIFAIAYPQDRTNLENNGYSFDVLEKIVDTITTN